ncbi:hypothetical protein [Paenibacillus antarcticus]|uniref:hypothetical protein n=1 Tax=Paenibacillus antarcticus TaxID=253703 RepID=UPI0011F19A15|nr:hypothetical protein [Paenibacillus antarcticus]
MKKESEKELSSIQNHCRFKISKNVYNENIVSTNKGSGTNAEQDNWLDSRSVSTCTSSGVLDRAG